MQNNSNKILDTKSKNGLFAPLIAVFLLINFLLTLPCAILVFSELHYGLSLLSFKLLFPFVAIIALAVLVFCKYKQYTKLFKYIVFVLNLIIFFVNLYNLLLLFIIFSLFGFNLNSGNFNNPKDYIQAKKQIASQYRVKHFPNSIPKEASNVYFYKTNNNFFGSETILLEFNANKQYVENELKKHKYIAIEKNDTLKNAELNRYNRMLAGNKEFDIENFTFYIINDRENENLEGHHFPYHYGIGVNKDFNQIIYYYDCPD